MSKIQVVVNGAKGRMGLESVKAVKAAEDLELIGALDIEDNLEEFLAKNRGCVAVDFTHPSCAYANALAIAKAGCHGVIGTTGFKQDQIAELSGICEKSGLGYFIAPNFAIGAVLMMRFAAEAGKYMERAEIVEIHHPFKADAPSGTAHKTAEMMVNARKDAGLPAFEGPDAAANLIPNTRGGNHDGIRIHAIRMPGALANQEVLLGAAGQTLTIRHDSMDRSCFMPGVVMACRRVSDLTGLVIGLDKLIWG